MLDFIEKLFDTSDFPARWHCGNWSAGHGWLHIVSDLAIWGAYMAIPATLAFFILKRKDIPFLPVFWLFAAFIFSCGTSHLIEAGIFWWPSYRLAGVVKLTTAVVSWATVFALFPVLPKALALPRLSVVNAELNAALIATQESEKRFRHVVEAVPNGIIIVDGDGKITLANSVCAEIFGYDPDELVGQSVEILVPTHLHAKHPSFREAFLDHPESRPMGHGRDLYGRRKDGSNIPVEIGLNPIESEQGTLVLASIVDISARKNAELTLARYTRELERSNRELDDFAFVASHDLRTPLEGIESLASWVQEDAASVLPEKSDRHLKQIQQRAGRLKRFLDDLLQYSRAGKRVTTTERVHCGDLVQDVILGLNPSLDMRFEVGSAMPVIDTVELPLRRTFQNLIGNAIKHHDRKDGTIRIDAEDRGDSYKFTVSDDGPGIDPQFHERIFQMFETLRPRDTVEGSGMGLSIVKKLLETYGATIAVDSSPGDGTTFMFTWPKKIVNEE